MERKLNSARFRTRLSSVANSLRLIKAFSEDEYEIGISDLAKRLGLAKSTVHRLASTLLEEGMLEQNPADGKYHPGLALFELGAMVRRKMDFTMEARPFLRTLMERTGETVHLGILDRDSILYIITHESKQALRMGSKVGTRVPVHSTAVGKTLLAFQPDEEIDRIIARGLPASTPNTIVDAKALRRELAAARLAAFARGSVAPAGLNSQPLPDRRGEPRLVHGVEVQAGSAGREQPVAQVGDHVQAEASDRSGIVTEALHLQAQPAGDLGAAGVGEARELREIPDRHDSRNDGQIDAERLAVVDEAEIGIDVVEILRDRRVGARLELCLEARDVLARAARLGMELRVAGDFDVEVVARPLADERHQVARVAKLAGARGARRQVSAQGDDVIDALRLVQLERSGDVGARGADAGDMGRRLVARGLDLQDGLKRAVPGGAARAVGAREEPGLQLRELLPGRAQPLHPFRGLRREKLEAEGARMFFLRFQEFRPERARTGGSGRGRACGGPPRPSSPARPRFRASRGSSIRSPDSPTGARAESRARPFRAASASPRRPAPAESGYRIRPGRSRWDSGTPRTPRAAPCRSARSRW